MSAKFHAPLIGAVALIISACSQMNAMDQNAAPAMGGASGNSPALGVNYNDGSPNCDHWGTGICYSVYDNPKAPEGFESNRSSWHGARY